jgi:hypothetical protein
MLSPRLTWGLTDPLADPIDLEIGWAIDLKEEVNAARSLTRSSAVLFIYQALEF